MSNIFRFFQNEIFPKVKHPLEIFLDLADLRKKTQPDISEAVIIIKAFQSPLRVTVSLNDKEVIELAENIARSENDKTQFSSSISDKDFVKIIQFLHSYLKISRIIIHHPRFALISVRNAKDELPEIIIVPNAYTKSAKFTVAAGDTFNAGICLGILAGIDPSAMLILGNVFTSYFIRTGLRGSKRDIHHFMDHYIEYLLVDQSDLI